MSGPSAAESARSQTAAPLPGDTWRRRLRRWWDAVWEQVFDTDPGRLRRRIALRAVISAGAAMGIMLLPKLAGIAVPNAGSGIAFLVSAFAAVGLRDASPRSQAMTLLLIPPAAFAAAAAGMTAAAAGGWVPHAGFVVAVLLTCLLRGLGPRGMALGMPAFFAYFLAVVVEPTAGDLPWIALGLGVSLASVAGTRFLLLPDDPQATLRHAMRDIRHRIARLIEEAAALLAVRQPDAARLHRLHRDMARLNDATLEAEAQIEAVGGRAAAPAVGASALGPGLFALELATERLVRAANGEPAEAQRRDDRAALATLAHLIEDDRTGPQDAGAGARQGGALAMAIAALRASILSVPTSEDAPGAAQPTQAAPTPRRDEPKQADGPEPSAGLWSRPAIRQAVQASVGTALAIGVGLLISDERWYWSGLAAFLVGIGVSSRSDAIMKGMQRTAGTVAGVCIGILLGMLVGGHVLLSLALVLICAFFAFYAWQSAYGVMVFWITLMLALLYGLLGSFTPGLLWLRLAETAAGSAAGVAVAALLLPLRSEPVFRESLGAFLLALGAATDAAAEDFRQPHAPSRARVLVRELDRKAQALRRSIGPLRRGWILLVAPRALLAARLAMEAAYLTRELAFLADSGASAPPGPLAARAADVRQRAASLQREVAGGAALRFRLTPEARLPGSRSGRVGAGQALELGSRAAAAHTDPLALLDLLDEALARLTRQVLAR